MSQHEAVCAIYTRNLQFKKEYFTEISRTLIHNKLELGEMHSREALASCRKVKGTEVVLSDMLGIQKADILIQRGPGERPEIYLFSGMTEDFFQKILLQIARRKTFSISVKLYPLLAGDETDDYRKEVTHKIFTSTLTASSPLRSPALESALTTQTELTENSSFSDIENEALYTEKKFRKILTAAYKRKKLRRKIRDRLQKYPIPKKLKEAVYDAFLRNCNRVDKDFVSAFSNTERGLPKNISRLMQANTDRTMQLFKLTDEFLAFEANDCLRLLYSYRPDVGYKSGMEVYAVLLGQQSHRERLRKVFLSCILDYDLLFAVFKGCDTHEFDIRTRLMGFMERRTGLIVKNQDFIWHTFLFLTSNCFSNLLPLDFLL